MTTSAADAPDCRGWNHTYQPVKPSARRTNTQAGQDRVTASGRCGPRASSSPSNVRRRRLRGRRASRQGRGRGDGTSTGRVGRWVARQPGGPRREAASRLRDAGPGRLVRRRRDGPGPAHAIEVAGQDEPAVADDEGQVVRPRAGRRGRPGGRTSPASSASSSSISRTSYGSGRPPPGPARTGTPRRSATASAPAAWSGSTWVRATASIGPPRSAARASARSSPGPVGSPGSTSTNRRRPTR